MGNKNLTAGDFCSGLPNDEKRALRESKKSVPGPVISTGTDTSHLSTSRAVSQAQCQPGEMRHGWHPNLKK